MRLVHNQDAQSGAREQHSRRCASNPRSDNNHVNSHDQLQSNPQVRSIGRFRIAVT
jgi:hypothetical protein